MLAPAGYTRGGLWNGLRPCVRASVNNRFSEMHGLISFKLWSMIEHHTLHMHIILFDDQIQDGRVVAILNFSPLKPIVNGGGHTCISDSDWGRVM